MKVGIVIPYYNKWNLTHARLYELYKLVSGDYFVVLVNDGSTDSNILPGIEWWQQYQTKFDIFSEHNSENEGFGKSMNMGASVAEMHGAEAIVLLSNDVSVSIDFVPKVLSILRQHPKALIGAEIIKHRAGWNEFEYNGKSFHVPYANGWFLSCTMDTWKLLGGFDSLYGKFDFEDIDLSVQAIVQDCPLIEMDTKGLHHSFGTTTNTYFPDRLQHTLQNRDKFIEKWKPMFPVIMQKLGIYE